ncbi:hypothetical protein NDU88_010551 [Pleurodeles waltl]|uniref:Reverse transcriptase domain-containing protein n=1 Tax=Pleurodeles waltl TaxID=8319 RepID=A0AAV7RZZ4_PLEWA|nr:hypothetical protein NDU88_010551 [Pleurodeles waltl]
MIQRYVSKILSMHLEDQQLLGEELFGFRPGHGTESALLIALDELQMGLIAVLTSDWGTQKPGGRKPEEEQSRRADKRGCTAARLLCCAANPQLRIRARL